MRSKVVVSLFLGLFSLIIVSNIFIIPTYQFSNISHGKNYQILEPEILDGAQEINVIVEFDLPSDISNLIKYQLSFSIEINGSITSIQQTIDAHSSIEIHVKLTLFHKNQFSDSSLILRFYGIISQVLQGKQLFDSKEINDIPDIALSGQRGGAIPDNKNRYR